MSGIPCCLQIKSKILACVMANSVYLVHETLDQAGQFEPLTKEKEKKWRDLLDPLSFPRGSSRDFTGECL